MFGSINNLKYKEEFEMLFEKVRDIIADQLGVSDIESITMGIHDEGFRGRFIRCSRNNHGIGR